MELKHIAGFIVFGWLGLYSLWYVARSVLTWRREGSLGVRNRLRGGMPGGPAVTMVVDWLRDEDPTDKRPVHQLRNPVVIVLWLLVCIAFAVACFQGAVEFLRFGHGAVN